MSKPHPDTPELDELIEKRIAIAAKETKSSDEVVQIAWLADGVGLWFRTNGGRGNSPDDTRRYIISSVTRLLAKRELEGRINELLRHIKRSNPRLQSIENKVIQNRITELREELAKYE